MRLSTVKFCGECKPIFTVRNSIKHVGIVDNVWVSPPPRVCLVLVLVVRMVSAEAWLTLADMMTVSGCQRRSFLGSSVSVYVHELSTECPLLT